jgi:hypothetical protein
VTTGKNDLSEAVGLVIAHAEGGFVGALDFWRTTSIDQEHLVTALAAIAVFLASQNRQGAGAVPRALQMLWAMEIGGSLELDGPLLGAAEIESLGAATGPTIEENELG